MWPGLLLGLVLGLLALGPGLRRGFLLSYDMVFVPRESFSAALPGIDPARAVPSDLVIAAVSRVMPADIVQKLVLLAIFMLAVAGVAALLEKEPGVARLAAGAFYAWNPYVAERLIIGQWALLLGYAGLPWVLRALRQPDLVTGRGATRLAAALLPGVIGGFAAMAITALVLVPVVACTRSVRKAATAIAALVVGSLPFLIPSLLHPVYADPAGVAEFAARADTPFGTLGSLLMLGGMWNADVVPKAYGGVWSALWLVIVLTAIAGAVASARWQRRWPGLGIAAGTGLVIACLGLTAPGRDLLRSVPIASVLRDGQQFTAPLALAEATGFGVAVSWIVTPRPFWLKGRADRAPRALSADLQPRTARGAVGPELGRKIPASRKLTRHSSTGFLPSSGDFPSNELPTSRTRNDNPNAHSSGRSAGADAAGVLLGVFALLAPVVLLPGLAWGAAGRLRPQWYPAGWLAAARTVDDNPVRGDALLLPWVADRTPYWNHGEAMLDPWPRLLSRPVIWNDGTQVGNVALLPDDPRARQLDAVIDGGGPLTAALTAAGIRFVLDDADGIGGARIRARLPGATVVINQPELVIYELP